MFKFLLLYHTTYVFWALFCYRFIKIVESSGKKKGKNIVIIFLIYLDR